MNEKLSQRVVIGTVRKTKSAAFIEGFDKESFYEFIDRRIG
jgi:hypothetical protein